MSGIAVVGCGRWGMNHIHTIMARSPESLVACWDIDPSALGRVKRLYPGVRSAGSLHEICDDPEVSGVVVATPHRTHYHVGKEALKHGKHVLIEKPFTETAGQAWDLVAEAASRNRVLLSGHLMTFHPAVVRLRDQVRSGACGTVQAIQSVRMGRSSQSDIPSLWDLGSHDIAAVMYILDEYPVGASIMSETRFGSGGEIALVSLAFASGAKGTIRVGWPDPYKFRRLTVVGDLAAASVEEEGQSAFLQIVSDRSAIRYEVVACAPLAAEIDGFVQSIDGNAVPASDGRMGAAVIAVLEALQQSASLGTGEHVPISYHQPLGRRAIANQAFDAGDRS